ncbi:MAG TPA: ComEC/Rec2 family competence protein [Campylobacterales bacterium]|nr:ComEC/Rec2 family competence protein [Campylobacterales bacterium]
MKENPHELNLFESKKEIVIFTLLMISIFAFNIYQKHKLFTEVTASKFYKTDAIIDKQYQKTKKTGKTYHVLKIKSDDGYSFYTTNYGDLKDISGRSVSIGFITDKIDFKSFVAGFYAPSYDIRLDEKEYSFKENIASFIKEQHENVKMKELFSALFLAEPISKSLRADVSFLGISHLIAISGFHLGVLFTILYFLFHYVYIYFQDRYFPYRNIKFDLTILILVLLFGYMSLIGYVPSVVRSFVMMGLGFFLFHRSFKIISFEVLYVTILFILAIIPEFLFSIGFWFSISGVFYIYLFLHHFSHLENWQIFLLLNFWVYIAMIPIVHFIFPDFSLYQLFSPFLTMAFSLFYPLEMLLHLLGIGDLLDGLVLNLFAFKAEIYKLHAPLWFLGTYLFVSILAIFHKSAIFAILILNLLFFVFI